MFKIGSIAEHLKAVSIMKRVFEGWKSDATSTNSNPLLPQAGEGTAMRVFADTQISPKASHLTRPCANA